MQTGIVACHGGVTGSPGGAAAGRVARERLSGEVARRRGVSARKRSRDKYAQDARSQRQISPATFELTEEYFSRVHKVNSAKRAALFHVAQCLSRHDREHGARLGQNSFSSEHLGKIMQEGIVACGLAACMDWDSWKPTGSILTNAKPRGFFPCVEFLLADTGNKVVSSLTDYLNGRFVLRAPLHDAKNLLISCPASDVVIPANVAEALQRGTGLYCDFDNLRALVMSLPADEQARKLCAALAAVGRVPGDEIRPIWEQHEWGRLYCSKPAAINMPTKLLELLRSIDGLPLWCVDFSSFELRIACKITGEPLGEGDAYALLAEPCGITRERVKAVINPMLHGQTLNQLRYAMETPRHLKVDRPLVEHEMKRSFPFLFAGLERFRRDGRLLQQRGAQVFFPCMAAAMKRCEITSAGLPKHDGWVFAASESQAKAVGNVFEAEAERIAGVHLPVKLAAVTLSKR